MVFPEFNLSETSLKKLNDDETDTPELGRVFLFDNSTGNHVLRDGKLVEASKSEAVEQWIHLVIVTEKGKYRVYDQNFGMELEQFKGRKDIPAAFVRSEIERQLEEQLLKHPLIESVSEVGVDISDGSYYITCTVSVAGVDDSITVGEYSA